MENFDEQIVKESPSSSNDSLATKARSALAEIQRGEEQGGIRHLQSLVRWNPTNLVLGNLLRMETLALTRRRLTSNAREGEIALTLPDYLDDQPMKFFRELIKERHER